MKGEKGVQVWLNSSCNLSASWGWTFNAKNRRLYSGKKIGALCTGGCVGPRFGKHRPTGTQSPHHPARSEALNYEVNIEPHKLQWSVATD